ncbi:NUDIX domain-containing protein [Candidatus Ichthyocystis hellenicum]|uniref:NUDIX domain-containing protein n=1 Tax=Candidatus Ichthyocystis hellenicum TaxID=1561003 RepID=UPI000B85F02E|nr:NUDIX domain-containing protein [Candidatus Ichthyocystis hellenicum]
MDKKLKQENPGNTMTGVVHVSAGIIERSDGSYLMTCRSQSQSHPGFWEFPGGKQELEEDHFGALVRELQEEIGIRVRKAYPVITKQLCSDGVDMVIRFWRVTDWENDPRSLEGQELFWQCRTVPVKVGPLLEANISIVHILSRPHVTIILDKEIDVGSVQKVLSKLETTHQVFVTTKTSHSIEELREKLNCPVIGDTPNGTKKGNYYTSYHWLDPSTENLSTPDIYGAWPENPNHDYCFLFTARTTETLTLPFAYYLPSPSLKTTELEKAWEMGAWGIYTSIHSLL